MVPELNAAQVLTGSSLGLDFGFEDVLLAELNGRILVFAYARIDGRLVELEFDSAGQLSAVGDMALGGMVLTGESPELELLESGSTILFSGYSRTHNGVLLDSSGSLYAQTNISGIDEIFAATAFNVAGQDYLIAAKDSFSVTLFKETGTLLQETITVSDTSDQYLGDISSTAVFEHGSTAQILAASQSEAGLTLLNVSSAGTLSIGETFGADRGLSVSGMLALEALELKDGNYAALAASATSSLSIVKVSAQGALQQTDHILDSTLTRFQGVTDIAATTVGDFAFLVAGGSDGGVSLFAVLPGGHFVLLDMFLDTETTTLARIGGLEMTPLSGALQIVASSPWEAGLTRLSYDLSALGSVMIANPTDGTMLGTSLDDQLVGSGSADLLQGAAGDDIIYDGAGRDTLSGGEGADLFVFEADGVIDRIEDFNATEDRLDLSSFDFLYSVDQLEILPTANGATISFRDEVIEVNSSNASPLTAADFTDEMVLNLDRPPQIAMARALQGGPLSDVLHGAEGFDTIRGGDGADTIIGNGGDDLLQGEDGDDQIDGGSGSDTLEGGSGADSLSGGEGDDMILGGSGGDVIYGDVHDWIDAV